MMSYLATYLIYMAVLARAVGWSYDSGPFSPVIWVLLAVFGLLLFTERRITAKYDWYPHYYILAQSVLVITMLYTAPTVDIFSMLLIPLSFQVVKFFKRRIGFILIGLFSLALAGMFLFGLELESGLTMIISATGVNFLMGNLEYLIDRTDQAKRENQNVFNELKNKFRLLKNSAKQAEALAKAEERHQLVRDMHDSLTQTLFGMNLAAQAAQQVVKEKPQEVIEYLDRLQTLAHNAVSEVHFLTGQTSITKNSISDFAEALKQLANQRYEQDGLQVHIELSGNDQLSKSIQAHLYGIVQESLNNVTRHAGVRDVIVRLHLVKPAAWLEIQDFGSGFDVDAIQENKGFGLNSMSERATEIGWNLEIESTVGKGTRIRVTERGI